MHRVCLDRMPIVDMARSNNLELLRTHAFLSLSDRERMRLSVDAKDLPAIVYMKQSIATMFRNLTTGTETGKKSNVFGLHKESGGGVGTVIFIEAVRLDLPSHTLIADGYVLPLNDALAGALIQKLGGYEHEYGITRLACTDEEIAEWAYLFPALVERCRDWSHKSDCAYRRTGAIPLATEHAQIPICNCGRGKVSAGFKKRKEWAPFVPYVTRIAISPIFAVSYLDAVGKDFAEMTSNMKIDDDGPKMVSAAIDRCNHCNAKAANDRLLRCSQCKKAAYCGKSCQTADWKAHKRVCVKI
jgi:hypothetical protein